VNWRFGLMTVAIVATSTGAAAQIPPSQVRPPTPPILNPSGPSLLPQAPEVPVSPGPGPGAAAVMHGTPGVIDPHPAPHHYRHRKQRHLDDY
jgi:hypothetical protein